MWRSILFSALFSMLCILLTMSRRHASEQQRCATWVECLLVRQRAFQRPRIAPTTRAAALAGRAGAIDGRKSRTHLGGDGGGSVALTRTTKQGCIIRGGCLPYYVYHTIDATQHRTSLSLAVHADRSVGVCITRGHLPGILGRRVRRLLDHVG